MSANSVIGDFDLNVVKLRKPLEFPDGTTQDTAYTGDGSETLAEVLAIGNDALGQDIVNVGDLEMVGAIKQNTLVTGNNVMDSTTIVVNTGMTTTSAFQIRDTTTSPDNSIQFIPNTIGDTYNKLVQDGDVVIACDSVSSLTITNDSATTNGIRMSDTEMYLGVGGAVDIPTNFLRFNNPADSILLQTPNTSILMDVGTITTNTNAGLVSQTQGASPNPAIVAKDTVSSQDIKFIPRITSGGQYNPFGIANSAEIVSSPVNVSTLAIMPHSSTTCGIRLTPTAVIMGAGGTGATPTTQIQLDATGVTFTGVTSNTAGAFGSNLFLPIKIGGTTYKIPLYPNA